MSLKDKIINAVTAQPKIVTFGIGLVITFVVATAIGMIDHNQAFANIHMSNTQSQGNQ